MKSASDPVSVEINKTSGVVPAGTTVAAAIMLLSNGLPRLRESITGTPRGVLCGMGTCHECRVTIDEVAQRRSCLVECRPGMRIQTDGL